MNEPSTRDFASRPHRTLVALAVPVMVSLVAEPLTGLVDTAFVARLGAAELAGLGVATVLLSSSLWVFNFLGVGTQTEVAQAVGARRSERAREMSAVAIWLAAGVGVAVSLASWPLLDWIASAMGAEGAVHDAARVYLEIRLLGAPALLVTLAAFGALRGLHDMRTPLWIALGSNALNVVLDAVLIFGLGPVPALGVAGAAWATVAAQWLAGALAVAAVQRRLGAARSVRLRDAAALLVVGRDLFARTGLLVLFLLLTTRAATRLGSDAGAAHQAIRQVWLLTALALDAFAAAAQSLVGSFMGAGDVASARRVASVACGWGLGTGVLLAALMGLSEGAVALALVPPEARAVFAAPWRFAAVFQPLNALSFVTDGVHWGTRDYRYLRNAMATASLLAAALLLATAARSDLADIWLITGAWISLRAVFGVARIWPARAGPLGRGPHA